MHPPSEMILAMRAYRSDVAIHRHAAYQLVLTKDHAFHTLLGNEQHPDVFGFVIRPQVAHSCTCSHSTLIVVNVEPYSFAGKYLAQKLGNAASAVFKDDAAFRRFFRLEESEPPVGAILRDLLSATATGVTDERILQAIAYIREHFRSGNLSTEHIARNVFLSPSRLGSLFRQQTGSSISKHLLWTRLRHAIVLILQEREKSITRIAMESGFYDAAQMNKYMYELFGISPSRLRQKSDLIQFLAVTPGEFCL